MERWSNTITTIERKTMKNINLCVTVLLACAFGAAAEETGPAKKNSAEFERIKTLVGKWTGKTDMGKGPVDIELEYRLIAAGSVVEERTFPGTPQEMVSMYYDDKNGKLAMTHYCMLGNRPQMTLKSSDAKSIALDFDVACGIDTKTECHMHSMKILFVDADTITTSGKALMNGKEMPECSTTFKRVK
jgi:hypothetical protein